MSYGNTFQNVFTYEFGYNAEITAIVLLIIAILAVLAWMIVKYVLKSISIFKIARRRGIPAYGLAWVPVLRAWALGGIADSLDAEENKNHRFRIAYLVLGVIAAALMVIAYVTLFAVVVRTIIAAEKLYGYSDLPAYETYLPIRFIVVSYVLLIVALLIYAGYCACSIICYYKLYELCKPKKALLLFLVAAIVPFAEPFVLISCANWQHGQKVKYPEYDAYESYHEENYQPGQEVIYRPEQNEGVSADSGKEET